MQACRHARYRVRMSQITVRASEDLVGRVRHAAEVSGRSMNEYIVAVLSAATDPELAGDDAARVRARLQLAGLLAAPTNDLAPGRKRPGRAAVAAARKRAGAGTPLSDLVAADR